MGSIDAFYLEILLFKTMKKTITKYYLQQMASPTQPIIPKEIVKDSIITLQYY
jgi:hypothetical protein